MSATRKQSRTASCKSSVTTELDVRRINQKIELRVVVDGFIIARGKADDDLFEEFIRHLDDEVVINGYEKDKV